MHFARPVRPRTTKATVRFGSSLSPPVTSLAAALTAALVAEPASRPAGKQQPCCTSKKSPAQAGGFLFRTAMLRNRFPEQCALKDPTVACPCTGRHLLKEMRTSRSSLSSYADDLMVGFEHREE